MEIDDFKTNLDENPDVEWKEEAHNGDDGIMVANHNFETITHFSFRKKAIENNDWSTLLAMTNHGKNIEHMTRVTGYFSKVSGWNSGKKGELKDRARTEM